MTIFKRHQEDQVTTNYATDARAGVPDQNYAHVPPAARVSAPQGYPTPSGPRYASTAPARVSAPQPEYAPRVPAPDSYAPAPPQSPLPPQLVPAEVKFQLRQAALAAARDFLTSRSYADNAERLKAEIDLAKFYLSED